MKKLWLWLVPVLLPACACPLPAILPVATQQPSDVSPPSSLMAVYLHPEDGDLTAQLHAEAPKAAALGQHMFVEFDASW